MVKTMKDREMIVLEKNYELIVIEDKVMGKSVEIGQIFGAKI